MINNARIPATALQYRSINLRFVITSRSLSEVDAVGAEWRASMNRHESAVSGTAMSNPALPLPISSTFVKFVEQSARENRGSCDLLCSNVRARISTSWLRIDALFDLSRRASAFGYSTLSGADLIESSNDIKVKRKHSNRA